MLAASMSATASDCGLRRRAGRRRPGRPAISASSLLAAGVQVLARLDCGGTRTGRRRSSRAAAWARAAVGLALACWVMARAASAVFAGGLRARAAWPGSRPRPGPARLPRRGSRPASRRSAAATPGTAGHRGTRRWRTCPPWPGTGRPRRRRRRPSSGRRRPCAGRRPTSASRLGQAAPAAWAFGLRLRDGLLGVEHLLAPGARPGGRRRSTPAWPHRRWSGVVGLLAIAAGGRCGSVRGGRSDQRGLRRARRGSAVTRIEAWRRSSRSRRPGGVAGSRQSMRRQEVAHLSSYAAYRVS